MDASTDATSGEGGTGDCTAALPKSLFCDPLGAMPMSIKATGLFPAAPDLTKHSASMLEYVPDPALWSDGMEKQRFLILPAGTKIDNTRPEAVGLPAGNDLRQDVLRRQRPGGQASPDRDPPHPVGEEGSGHSLRVLRLPVERRATDATLVVNDIDGDPEMTDPGDRHHQADRERPAVHGQRRSALPARLAVAHLPAASATKRTAWSRRRSSASTSCASTRS